jgi:hypothetical protein
MAGVGNTFPTLLDLSSRMENGSVAKQIIELLAPKNEVLDDIPWLECNDGSGHITTVRTGLPSGTWRKFNYGVNQEKSTTAQIRDTTGMLQSYSTIDAKLVQRAKDPAAFRKTEDMAQLQGLTKTFMDQFIQGTSANPERFVGLMERFNDRTGPENAENILTGGGAGADNTSIWLCVFGETSVHGIYPSGSQAGLMQKDLGEQTVYDSNNDPYQAFRTLFGWDCGLTVRDWRQVVRIANIDVSDLTKDASAGADLLDLMVQALELVHDMGAGRPAFLMNRTIKSFLRRQMLNKDNALIRMDEMAGKPVLSFGGVPCRRVDAILNSEAVVA